ncbi:DUF1385 domain-containing protein, partial [Alkalihalophilus pseudofirmus]
IIAIIEASANGSKHLNFSTERYDLDPKDDDTLKQKEVSRLTMYLGAAVIGVISFIIGKFAFTLVPALLAELTRPIFPSDVVQVFIESV